ncbi:MAG TPA: hypothetical protein VGM07_05010 [Stellaceae bacterium]|jgi:hypothetical protein
MALIPEKISLGLIVAQAGRRRQGLAHGRAADFADRPCRRGTAWRAATFRLRLVFAHRDESATISGDPMASQGTNLR